MKYSYLLLALLSLSCAEGSQTVLSNDLLSSQDPSPPPPHFNPVEQIPSVEIPDAGTYNPCAVKLKDGTQYDRLWLQVCIDSNFQQHTLPGYWDAELLLICNWKKTTDGIERCLPFNLQSAFFYSDADCSVQIAMTEPGQFDSQYVGLVDYTTGTVREFDRGADWNGGPEKYYRAPVNGNVECLESDLIFLGTKTVLVGAEVYPITFVGR